MSSHFHQEFPSLQAAGEGEKDGQEEEPYGPGPSLRPQSMAAIMDINMMIHCQLFFFLRLTSEKKSTGFLAIGYVKDFFLFSC